MIVSSVFGGLAIPAENVSAETLSSPKIVDDFEDGDLSEYDGTTGPGTATIQSTDVKEGSNALEIHTTDGLYTQINSSSGLDNYPQAGDTFGAWTKGVNGTAGARQNIIFGAQSPETDNMYSAKVDIANDAFIIDVFDSGTRTVIDETPVTLSENTWYEVEVQWGLDGKITATLYDESGTELATVSGTDSTYDSGAIGYKQEAMASSGDSTGYFDYYRITESKAEQDTEISYADDFEDDSLNSFPSDWEVSEGTDSDVWVTDSKSSSGSQSLKIEDASDAGDAVRPTDQLYYYKQTEDISSSLLVTGANLDSASTTNDWDSGDIRLLERGTLTAQVKLRHNVSTGETGLYAWKTSGENADTDAELITDVPTTNEWVHVRITNIDPVDDTYSAEWETPADSGVATGLPMRNAMTDGYDETRLRGDDEVYFDNFKIGNPYTTGPNKQSVGLIEDDLGMFPPDETEVVVYKRSTEYKSLEDGMAVKTWHEETWEKQETSSFNWQNKTTVSLEDTYYYRLELESSHGNWEDSGFVYDESEMAGSTIWLEPETGHLDSNSDGTAGGSGSVGTNGAGSSSTPTADEDGAYPTVTEQQGFGPTALGTCTAIDGQDGVEVEYWDPNYETHELRGNVTVDGSTTYHIRKSFDTARGYYRGCIADSMTENASAERSDLGFNHTALDQAGNEISTGSTSWTAPTFGPTGKAPESTGERLGLLAGVLGALGALWIGGNRVVPASSVPAWPSETINPAFGIGAPIVTVLGLDLAGGGVISAGVATGLAQIAPFAGIVGVSVVGYAALRWIRAPPSS